MEGAIETSCVEPLVKGRVTVGMGAKVGERRGLMPEELAAVPLVTRRQGATGPEQMREAVKWKRKSASMRHVEILSCCPRSLDLRP